MTTRRSLPLLAILVLGLGFACSSGPDPDGPEAAVTTFIDRLNDGNYDGAKELYNAEALALVDDPNFGSADAFREWANTLTNEGTVSRVEILDSQLGEAEGTIQFRIDYKDGSNHEGTVSVTHEDGRWKVGLFS